MARNEKLRSFRSKAEKENQITSRHILILKGESRCNSWIASITRSSINVLMVSFTAFLSYVFGTKSSENGYLPLVWTSLKKSNGHNPKDPQRNPRNPLLRHPNPPPLPNQPQVRNDLERPPQLHQVAKTPKLPNSPLPVVMQQKRSGHP